MRPSPEALQAAQQAWGNTPPLPPAALDTIGPIWWPAYQATTEPHPEQETPDAA